MMSKIAKGNEPQVVAFLCKGVMPSRSNYGEDIPHTFRPISFLDGAEPIIILLPGDFKRCLIQ
jgi:hypothetical protein